MNSSIKLRETLQKGKLLHVGAESNIFSGFFLNKEIIIKERAQKRYRHPVLDKELRFSRTQREAKVLIAARRAGISVPKIFGIDLTKSSIILEFIPGIVVDSIVGTKGSNWFQVLVDIGRETANLHLNGIIHGDLTLFNIIKTPQDKIFLIDFGLADFQASIEQRAIDLFTLFYTIKGTHSNFLQDCEKAIREGYQTKCGEKETNSIFKRIWEVSLRGRYVSKINKTRKINN